jgi:hypothetical protein
MAVNRPNGNKNIPRFSIARPSKIYPNWVFGFENKPSGNLGSHCFRGTATGTGDERMHVRKNPAVMFCKINLIHRKRKLTG